MTRRTGAEILQAKKDKLARLKANEKIRAERKKVDDELAAFRKKRKNK